MDSGPAGAYAPHDAALLDYFRDHTSATVSWFGQYGPRKGGDGSKSIDPRGERRLRVLAV